jgi:hypothetical protein
VKKLVLFAFIVVLLVGCISSQDKLVPNTVSTLSPTIALTENLIKATVSATSQVQHSLYTATPFVIPTPTLTPTFWAKCPESNAKLTPDFKSVLSADFPEVEEPILDFLNKGGTGKAVIEALETNDPTFNKQHFLERDITGDNIPELIIGYGSLYVFGCNQGMYETMLTVQTDRGNLNDTDPWVDTIRDVNADGVPEFVVTSIFSPFTWVRVYEWKDEQFQKLIKATTPNTTEPDNVASLMGAKAGFREIEDGTFELRLEGGIPGNMSLYWDGYPWRRETDIYRWDGTGYVFYRQEFEQPKYRFQAIQDGDRASLVKDYEAALAFYQDVIFNDKLDSWSQERRDYEFACFEAGSSDCSALSVSIPDPNEYGNLAGYARFRIMLLHIAQGHLPEAQTVYDTLQQKYPKGQTGNAYAEMATTFWDEYQASHNVEKGCNAAVKYAKEHPANILTYLGNSDSAKVYFGDQSLVYNPADICPLK